MWQALMSRLSQPSTWAGVGIIVSSAAQAAATKDPAAIGQVVAGVAAVVLNERGASGGRG